MEADFGEAVCRPTKIAESRLNAWDAGGVFKDGAIQIGCLGKRAVAGGTVRKYRAITFVSGNVENSLDLFCVRFARAVVPLRNWHVNALLIMISCLTLRL
jgi:hypothetical protein